MRFHVLAMTNIPCFIILFDNSYLHSKACCQPVETWFRWHATDIHITHDDT